MRQRGARAMVRRNNNTLTEASGLPKIQLLRRTISAPPPFGRHRHG
jgi:hypothetical protein